jgi:hypothetical protein
VAAEPGAFLRAPARYLVVHRDPLAEEKQVLAYLRPMAHRAYTESAVLRTAATAMETRLRREWGAPQLESPEVVVWDLDRARRESVFRPAATSCGEARRETLVVAKAGRQGETRKR